MVNGEVRERQELYTIHNMKNIKIISTILPLKYDVFYLLMKPHALHPLHMPNIDDKDFRNIFYCSIDKSWINNR